MRRASMSSRLRSHWHSRLLAGALLAGGSVRCTDAPPESVAAPPAPSVAATAGSSSVPITASPAVTGPTAGMSAPAQPGGIGGSAGVGGGAAAAGGAGSGASNPSGPSFTAVYNTVFMSCQNKACHGGRDGLGLRMETRDSAYASLVDQPASETVGMCGGKSLMLIVPSKPEASLVFLKIAGTPPCGGAMPPGGSPSADDLAQLKAWIVAGAPNN
jgi:hypothetical protein